MPLKLDVNGEVRQDTNTVAADLRHPQADRVRVVVLHALSRRRVLHRHAGRRGAGEARRHDPRRRRSRARRTRRSSAARTRWARAEQRGASGLRVCRQGLTSAGLTATASAAMSVDDKLPRELRSRRWRPHATNLTVRSPACSDPRASDTTGRGMTLAEQIVGTWELVSSVRYRDRRIAGEHVGRRPARRPTCSMPVGGLRKSCALRLAEVSQPR